MVLINVGCGDDLTEMWPALPRLTERVAHAGVGGVTGLVGEFSFAGEILHSKMTASERVFGTDKGEKKAAAVAVAVAVAENYRTNDRGGPSSKYDRELLRVFKPQSIPATTVARSLPTAPKNPKARLSGLLRFFTLPRIGAGGVSKGLPTKAVCCCTS